MSKTSPMLLKLKRFSTSVLPVDSSRRGECNRCGACCQLPFPCPFLRFDEEGLSSCAVYHVRPPSCRKYPRTASEHITQDQCGYYFETADEVSVGDPILDPVANR